MNRFFRLQAYALFSVALLFFGCNQWQSDSAGPTPIPVRPENAGGAKSTFNQGANADISSQPENAGSVKNISSYILRPTDALSAEMYMDPNIRIQQLRISQDGEVILPLIGSVKIEGLTLQEAQKKIHDLYAKFYKNPNIILTITQFSQRRVYVNGFVGAPGPVLIPPEEEMTLSRAISSARGILPRGSRTDVKITRTYKGVNEVYSVNMRDIDTGKALDFPLMEDDVIYVRDSMM